MRTVYIDKDFICHSKYITGRRKFVVNFLDNVSDECLIYYRYVPNGEVYTKNNKTIHGEFIQVIENNTIVDLMEKNIKQEQEYLNELAELIDIIYEQDLEMIDNV